MTTTEGPSKRDETHPALRRIDEKHRRIASREKFWNAVRPILAVVFVVWLAVTAFNLITMDVEMHDGPDTPDGPVSCRGTPWDSDC